MKWQGRRGSDNIEDRRGAGGGGVRLAGGGGLGVLAIVIIAALMGYDVTPLLNSGAFDPGAIRGGQVSDADRRAGEFVSVALADTEQVWGDIFQQDLGRTYRPTTLVLFTGATRSACGGASEATGPFYCPEDKKVYLDTGFFATLANRLGAGGDFAQAYVVAHEVGHHVQDELGILAKVNSVRMRSDEATSNRLSVMIELQADCLSGVWARHAADSLGTLDAGDMNEAINAAQQIGDDTLLRNAGQVPMPDSFTHGTSTQRKAWLARGYKAGSIKACDTFSDPAL